MLAAKTLIRKFHGFKGDEGSLKEFSVAIYPPSICQSTICKKLLLFDTLAAKTFLSKFHGFKGNEGSLEEVLVTVYPPNSLNLSKYLWSIVKKN